MGSLSIKSDCSNRKKASIRLHNKYQSKGHRGVCACACACRHVQGLIGVRTCAGVCRCAHMCAGVCRGMQVTGHSGKWVSGLRPWVRNCLITTETGQGPGLRGHLLIPWADQLQETEFVVCLLAASCLGLTKHADPLARWARSRQPLQGTCSGCPLRRPCVPGPRQCLPLQEGVEPRLWGCGEDFTRWRRGASV